MSRWSSRAQPGVLVRETRDFTLAQDWSTVLAAAGITHELRTVDGAFRIMVDFADLDAAANALEAFDNEAREEREERAARVADRARTAQEHARALGGAAAALVPSGRRALGGARSRRAGSAVGNGVGGGDPARPVVARGHGADPARGSAAPVGNVVATLIFVSAVGRALGPGLGALAILLRRPRPRIC